MDDASLLSRYRNGDAKALNLLLERHAPIVRAVCRRRLNDHALADDAAQAVFQVLAAKAASLREPRALAAWLHRTALNASDHVRRAEERRRARERIAGEALAREAVMSADAPATDDHWEAVRPHLDAAVNGLRPAQRDVVVGYYLQGKPQAEVASELGCSEAAVKMRLQGALEKLRQVLARRGVAISSMALATLLLGSARAEAVEQSFTAACLGAANGGASPAVHAISQGLLKAGAAKLFAAATAMLALLAGAGVALAIATAPDPVPSTTATPPPAPTAPATQEASMNPLIPMTVIALATATAGYADDNGGNAPAPRTNPPGGIPAPSNTMPGSGATPQGPANGMDPAMAQQWQAQQRGGFMSVGLGAQGKEVELVVLPISADGGDKAVLARWAELAGEGYEIAQVIDQGNRCYLFLQRNRVGRRPIQLPAAVEQDKALADTVRENLKAYAAAQGQRQSDPAREASAPAQPVGKPAAGF
jgi:RNA polymerase sigma factor (sigma-70 family)